MTNQKLTQAVDEIKQHRCDIIAKLVQFSKTDSLLYWDKDSEIASQQEQLWTPILLWAGQTLHADYKTTSKIELINQEKKALDNMRQFMESMNDKELAAFYLASMNMKSELLAAALVKGKINAEQAYKAAYIEEICQAERWGKDELAEKRRQELKQELTEIEDFLKQ